MALPQLASGATWSVGSTALDRAVAIREWEGLATAVVAEVAPVTVIDAEPWAPAMTYVRDAAISWAGGLVPLRPIGGRGVWEPPLLARALDRLGIDAPAGDMVLRLDGGNVILDHHDRILLGLTVDPDAATVAAVGVLKTRTGRAAVGVPLDGRRYPHLDLALCDLGGRGWLVYPAALPGFDLDDAAWQDLFLGRPVIEVDGHDGERLACNLVVAGDVVIGPSVSWALEDRLGELGFTLIALALDELRKGGGGAHCCTLELWA